MTTTLDMESGREGALAGPVLPEATGRVAVSVHDATQLAWQATVPMPYSGRARYCLEVEVEVPSNVGGAIQPWAALQCYARLDGAADSKSVGTAGQNAGHAPRQQERLAALR